MRETMKKERKNGKKNCFAAFVLQRQPKMAQAWSNMQFFFCSSANDKCMQIFRQLVILLSFFYSIETKETHTVSGAQAFSIYFFSLPLLRCDVIVGLVGLCPTMRNNDINSGKKFQHFSTARRRGEEVEEVKHKHHVIYVKTYVYNVTTRTALNYMEILRNKAKSPPRTHFQRIFPVFVFPVRRPHSNWPVCVVVFVQPSATTTCNATHKMYMWNANLS